MQNTPLASHNDFLSVERKAWAKSLAFHAASILTLLLMTEWNQDWLDPPIEITELIPQVGEPSERKPSPVKSANPNPAPRLKTNVATESNSNASTSSTAPSNAGTLGGATDGPVSEDYEVAELPVLLTEVKVPYPLEAKNAGAQGAVVLDIVINKEGAVRSAEVVNSPHPALSEAAKKAMLGFRFKPARQKDQNVTVRIRYTYRFRLE